MNPVVVGKLTFAFAATAVAEQYEADGKPVAGWPLGTPVVDLVASQTAEHSAQSWFVEVKDFRVIDHPPADANLQGLPTTIERKLRSTLRGLRAVSSSPAHPLASHAATAVASATKRVVLHAEPHPRRGPHSRLFPLHFPISLHSKLRRLLADIDPNPLILTIATTPTANVPWTVT